MDFEFSEEQQRFLAEVEAFLDERQTVEVIDPTRENMAQISTRPSGGRSWRRSASGAGSA